MTAPPGSFLSRIRTMMAQKESTMDEEESILTGTESMEPDPDMLAGDSTNSRPPQSGTTRRRAAYVPAEDIMSDFGQNNGLPSPFSIAPRAARPSREVRKGNLPDRADTPDQDITPHQLLTTASSRPNTPIAQHLPAISAGNPVRFDLPDDSSPSPNDNNSPNKRDGLDEPVLDTQLVTDRYAADYARNEELENKHIQDALAQSLKDLDRKIQQQNRPKHSVQRNVDDTLLGLSNEFSPIRFSDGDTLVYIGPPPMMKGEDIADYSYVSRHFDQPHRLRSYSLKSLGSEKFNKFLGPMSIRTERRLRKSGVLGHFDMSSIKLFVDLRPPNEDEEAIILLTDLTCTRGVLSWYKAQGIFGIGRTLICGKDTFRKFSDAYTIHNRSDRATEEVPGKDKAKDEKSNESPRQSPEPEDGTVFEEDVLEPEYSPLRHRSAIERLLQAIEFGDPKLDSAPKVWTYFALAKYFDCATHERINGWITRWLLVDPNINFIQCNPEVVLRIGMGIMSAEITRDAFSILAGEKALLDVYGEADPTVLAPLNRSIHGRKLELLDEDERNRIDHAAASLVRRVRTIFKELVDERMIWLEDSTEYLKLINTVTRDAGEELAVQETIQLIKEFVRGRVYWLLCRDYTGDMPNMRRDVQPVSSFYPGVTPQYFMTYNRLNQPMRLFTRTFWMALSQEKIHVGQYNTSNDGAQMNLISNGWNRLATAMEKEYILDPLKGIKSIPRRMLFGEASRFNEIRGRHVRQDEAAEQEAIRVQQGLTNFADTMHHAQEQALALAPKGKERMDGSSQFTSRWSPPRHDRMAYTDDPLGDDLDAYGLTQKRTHEIAPSLAISPEKRQRVDSGDTSPILSMPTTTTLPLRNSKLAGNALDVSGERTTADGDASRPTRVAELESPDFEMFGAPEIDNTQAATETPSHGEAVTPRKFLSFAEINQFDAPEEIRVAKGLDNAKASTTPIPAGESSTRKQLRPCTPPIVGEMEYDWLKSPGNTKYGFTKGGEEKLPAKYFPPPTRATTGVSTTAQGFGPDPAITSQPIYGAGDTRMPSEKTFLQSTLKEWEDKVATKMWRPEPLSDAAAARAVWDTPPLHSTPIAPANPSPRSNPAVHPFSHFRPLSSGTRDARYLNITEMLEQFTHILHNRCTAILYPPHLFHGADLVPTDLIDTLLCLDEDEWKYLPLWAGGNDDGTGGVFDEADVPNLEKGGFRGGKRGIGNVDGTPVPSADMSTDDGYSEIGSEAVSTVGRASRAAQRGYTETVMEMSDDASSVGDGSFLRQDELWEQIREMRETQTQTQKGQVEGEGKGKGKERAVDDSLGDDFDMQLDDDDDGDISTVQGAGSDVQGEMFGDIDDDEEEDMGVAEEGDESEESDLEIIDKEAL